MKLKALKKFESANYELSKLVSWVKEYLDQFSANTFIRGEYLTLTVEATGTSVPHRLGEVPAGWIIVDRDTGANVWRTSWNDRIISLQSSAKITLTIWVF